MSNVKKLKLEDFLQAINASQLRAACVKIAYYRVSFCCVACKFIHEGFVVIVLQYSPSINVSAQYFASVNSDELLLLQVALVCISCNE